MKRTKLLSLAAAAAALTAFAAPAQAAETITISGASGIFGNDSVGAAGSATANFTNTFTFAAPVGFNLANATLSTTSSPLGTNNIDFTSALLNGVAFTLSPTGTFEFGSAGPVALLASNTITVMGRNTGDGAFSGTLTFAATSAVPEPATWGMMLLGFGAVGFSLRRKRVTLAQAA